MWCGLSRSRVVIARGQIRTRTTQVAPVLCPRRGGLCLICPAIATCRPDGVNRGPDRGPELGEIFTVRGTFRAGRGPYIERYDAHRRSPCRGGRPRWTRGATMSELTTMLAERFADARRSLLEARRAGDDYLVDVRLSEIEELARLARENDVVIPGLERIAA